MITSGEDISEYSQLKYYDDNALKVAQSIVGNWKASSYSNRPWLQNNCQNYGEAIERAYYNVQINKLLNSGR